MRSLRVQESPHQSPGCQNNEFPPRKRHVKAAPDVTKELKKVCVKLEVVARDRYVMQQKARIEKCRSGMDLKNLEQIRPKIYT